jgi:hypothetical protein
MNKASGLAQPRNDLFNPFKPKVISDESAKE